MASPLSLTQQEKGINLMHIESRPSRLNNQEFEFFISVDTSNSKSLDEVIDGLRTEISGHVHEGHRCVYQDWG
jgi:phenylalanine-4-hydroxylase